ncbi:hypothetical protein PSTT_09039 [Puccinia striiformis]|uniref:Uncharacterized protein n=1 Tax=Puccinia striiformis TaxID=27350 RepID=A0A2S4VA07_9BASI|nr:hypothetical protein PSTT_09039 [Puccinia striiformis]
MEDTWPLNDKNKEGKPIKPHKRTLKLNSEKGMEGVLGVQTDQVIQLNEIANHHLQHKSSFYGTQLSPSILLNPTPNHLSLHLKLRTHNSSDRRTKRNIKNMTSLLGPRYVHIVGSDGLPCPPTSYISKPANKILMVFTNVSEFPQAPKPMSKRQARYFPKTSLLPDYLAEPTCSSQPTLRRSHSTVAPTIASVDPINNAHFFPAKGDVCENSIGSNPQQVEKMAVKRRILVTQLLSQLKGCLRLENSSKLLDQIRTSSNYSEFRNLTGIDKDQIKESVLLRAGGLSFKTPVMSEDEKPIGSIKFDMIKSIYLKKLELNPSGRLLLAKSVRSKEERDLKPCQHTTSSASTSPSILNTGRNSTTATTTGPSSQTNPSELSGSTSNPLVQRCMKGV